MQLEYKNQGSCLKIYW